MTAPDLARYAWLSIAAALTTIVLKAAAYAVTGSVGLLSDALESGVNLVAAIIALWALRVAAAPPDAEHPHGHDKAEYFSSGAEGALIFVAAVLIVASAVPRLLAPRELETVGLGLAVSVGASVVNLVVARVLLRAGRANRSIALEADGHHLMTDVWTSAGVIVGVGLVELTGVKVLDPLVAIAVAVHILWTGYGLVRRSVRGLMDPSLPADERLAIEAALDTVRSAGATWHALRTRQSGARRFAAVHVLVPGAWTVERAHDLAEEVEERIRVALHPIEVVVHLEPLEDPRAWRDEGPGDAHADASEKLAAKRSR
jgi:cation diffusion facilitator family transporter